MFTCKFTICLDNIQIGGSVYKSVGDFICTYMHARYPMHYYGGECKKAFLSIFLVY